MITNTTNINNTEITPVTSNHWTPWNITTYAIENQDRDTARPYRKRLYMCYYFSMFIHLSMIFSWDFVPIIFRQCGSCFSLHFINIYIQIKNKLVVKSKLFHFIFFSYMNYIFCFVVRVLTICRTGEIIVRNWIHSSKAY